MFETLTVSATEFSRNFARYQDEAMADGLVHVTSHGRVVGAYLSARELTHYLDLKRRAREVLVVGNLDKGAIADLEAAVFRVDPK